MDKNLVGIFAANPYVVTNMVNNLEFSIKADIFYAYNFKDAIKFCVEKKPKLIIVDSSIIKEKEQISQFEKYKMILITPLNDFASMQIQLDNIVEVLEKPVDLVMLANIIRKELSSK